MNAIRMVWVISRHYNTDERMVPLMELIAGEIAGKVHHLLHIIQCVYCIYCIASIASVAYIAYTVSINVFSEFVEWNMPTTMQVSVVHSPCVCCRSRARRVYYYSTVVQYQYNTVIPILLIV